MERGTGSAKRPLCQRGQQRRSGIMAPTMPASRVQIICRCNRVTHFADPDQSEPRRRSWERPARPGGRGRQASGVATEVLQPGKVAGPEGGHAAARGLHQVPDRFGVAEPQNVGELVEHDRPLLPRQAETRGVRVLDVYRDPAADVYVALQALGELRRRHGGGIMSLV